MGVQDRKQREFARREREILDAALGLFSSDDWLSVTVERIAEVAEIGKGTVYKHFASKEEIYASLALEFHRAVLADLESINPERPVLERLKAVLRTLWFHHRRAIAQHRVLEHTSRPSFWTQIGEPLSASFAGISERYGRIYTDVLDQGVREGVFIPRPLPLLLFGASAAVSGAIQQLWTGCLEGVDADEYLQALTDFIVGGLTQQGR